ncbi:MAG: NADH-quinone oxidoreductase subunit L [Armatimonadetes bacterium]|nr:NADH-quinone oxidoreductase subunit L [Candidatus Hippobium faecium]
MNYLLYALTALPLFGCVLASSVTDRKARNTVVWIFACLILLCGVFFGIGFIKLGESVITLAQDMSVIHSIGLAVFSLETILLAYIVWRGVSERRWTSPFLAVIQFIILCYYEFVLHPEFDSDFISVDNLSMILMMLVSVIGPLILIFAMGYMQEHENHLHIEKTKQPQFFGIIFFFLFAMNALAISNNLSWLCAFWEMTTLCSFLLIQHDKTDESVRNAFKTLDLNMVGGVAFILGIALIYKLHDITSINQIYDMPLGNYLCALPIILFCIAGMTKSAQFPFQKWLLGAMVAPTPVSALLHSSTMVNAGVYLILRMSPIMTGTFAGEMVAVAGGFTFMAASALAISQSNGKKVLAYSTIANLGLIVCLAGIGTNAAMSAGMLLMIFHAVSKGLLFLSVGTIEQRIGSRDIEDMQGMLKIMPFTTAILSLGMVSMLLPPFGVLVSKWIAIECAVGMPLVLVFIIMGSALTVVFWSKWLGIVTTSSYKKNLPKEKVLPTTGIVLVVMALMVILTSFCIQPVINNVTDNTRANIIERTISANIDSENSKISLLACSGNLLASSPLLKVMPNYHLFGAEDGEVVIFDLLNEKGKFSVLPFFILMFVLVLLIPFFIFGLKASQVRPPYTGGELANNDVRGIEFIGPGEKVEKVIVRNYYFNNIFSEKILSMPLTGIALLIIFVMLGGVF